MQALFWSMSYHFVSFTISCTPSTTLIHLSVKYIPAWFPGASWKRLGNAWNNHLQIYSTTLFEAAKSVIVGTSFFEYHQLCSTQLIHSTPKASDKFHHSVVKEMLHGEDLNLDEVDKEHLTKWIAATIYISELLTVEQVMAY